MRDEFAFADRSIVPAWIALGFTVRDTAARGSRRPGLP